MSNASIIIAGAGAAGMIGALAAAHAGATVLLLERDAGAPSDISTSHGLFSAAGTPQQRAAGIVDSPALWQSDIRAKVGDQVDNAILETVTRRAADVVAFLADRVGFPIHVNRAAWPGHSANRLHGTPGESGRELTRMLREKVMGHPAITWQDGAEATALIADGGTVRGVEYRARGKANSATGRAVLLATGGFAANPAMLRQFCPEAAEATAVGGVHADGRGIGWGTALGAQTLFMAAYQGHPHVHLEKGTRLSSALPGMGSIQVDRGGRRFVDESMGPSELTAHVLAHPGAVEIWGAGAHAAAANMGPYRDSLDNGAIQRFDDLAGLAGAFALPLQALSEEIAAFNAAAASGGPDRFGRKRFGAAIAAPFYGFKVTGGLAHTQGGLRVDRSARVLRADGSVIPGLYAAGGTAASVSGNDASGYVPGNGLAQAFSLGLAAGEAMATPP